MSDLPTLAEVTADVHVVRLPMRVPFRGVLEREALLLRGPAGWGEFSTFLEYDDHEASRWLAAAIDTAWHEPPPAVRASVPVNATMPAVAARDVAAVLERFPGCTTVKVKVAEQGQSLSDDVSRVAQVRAVIGSAGRIRVDANGAWSVDDADRALAALARYGLEYAEQPCASLDELGALRRLLAAHGTDVLIAADESIRKADDPLHVVRSGAADVAVLKVAPLGGVRKLLDIATQIDIPIVVSSALDSAVGIGQGLLAAAALPELRHACGLGTGGLFAEDVAEPVAPVDGYLPVHRVIPDPARLDALKAPPERRQWWIDRVTACLRL